MADDKRFPPTPKRLRDARRQGDVAHSHDVSGTLVFAGLLALLWGGSGVTLELLQGLWNDVTAPLALQRADSTLPRLLVQAEWLMAWVCIAVCMLAALLGTAGSYLQVGALAAWQRLRPNAAYLNPASGLTRLFSTRNLINLAKILLKSALLAGLLYVVVRGLVVQAARIGHLDAAGQLQVAGRSVLTMMAWAAVVYAVMAAVDYLHQQHEHTKQLRMSLQDLRREHHESEGNPMMQQRRRSEHHDTVFWSVADRLARATLVVHSGAVAVALQYLAADQLPRVLARGQADGAAQIRRLAAEHQLYDEDNPALAETLYREVASTSWPRPRWLRRWRRCCDAARGWSPAAESGRVGNGVETTASRQALECNRQPTTPGARR